MRILKRMDGGRFLAVFAGQGPPDYLAKVGEHSFIIEAKEFKGARWPFSLLPAHQAEQMDAWCAQHPNGHGVLLIRGTTHNATWVVLWRDLSGPWKAWARIQRMPGRAKPGAASFSPEQLDSVGVQVRGADWLPGVMALIRK